MFTVNVTTCTAMLQMTGWEAEEDGVHQLNPFCWQNTHQWWMELRISSPSHFLPLVAPCHQTLQVYTLLQVPVRLYGNSTILNSFTAILHLKKPVHSYKKKWWNNPLATVVLSKASILNFTDLKAFTVHH
jgi:hypothetical protein